MPLRIPNQKLYIAFPRQKCPNGGSGRRDGLKIRW